MRWLLWSALLPLSAFGQTPLTGRVLDARTKAPLAYCSVSLASIHSGTLTNEEGLFTFPNVHTDDSLIFSFVGYHRSVLSAKALRDMPEVRMEPSVTELRELEVRPGDDALYQLVARCAKGMRRSNKEGTRAYFEMDTHMDGQPVEVLECFYNAQVDGPHIEQLELKHGRIGLAPLNERYFVSLDMTRAMCLFDPRNDQVKFPMGPLLWTTERAIRKHYRVQYQGAEQGGADHLLLEPRDTSGRYFTVDLWLDGNTAEPRSITLACTNCRTHPFVPLKSMDRIERIDMQVRLTFAPNERQRAALQHLELGYDLRYRDDRAERTVHTTAVVRLFDRGQPFILPFFAYAPDQNDYRRITFQPYDSAFWETAPTLVRTAQQERDRAFFATHGILSGRTRIGPKQATFFESNHAWWSPEKRVTLKSIPGAEAAAAPQRQRGASIPVSQVSLEAQLYLDMDTANRQARYFTATVLDGFRSYYRLPEQPWTNAFINLFFDLCEMERRELERALPTAGTDVAQVRALHAAATERMRHTTARYMKETRLGADRIALQRWNDSVVRALGIDNLAMFRL